MKTMVGTNADRRYAAHVSGVAICFCGRLCGSRVEVASKTSALAREVWGWSASSVTAATIPKRLKLSRNVLGPPAENRSGRGASYADLWTRPALDRLLGNQDQAEVRPGSSRAEYSGVVERVRDRSDAGDRCSQDGKR